MFSAKKKAAQSEFWIPADQVVSSAKSGFYAKLEETLGKLRVCRQGPRVVCSGL